jgi:hypothetical protein
MSIRASLLLLSLGVLTAACARGNAGSRAAPAPAPLDFTRTLAIRP